MVTRRLHHTRGSLSTEMVVAMAFMLAAILPLALALAKDQRYLKANYLHAVAMAAVDGEMEILVAGEWQAFPSGTQPYEPLKRPVNLPPGKFDLTITGKHLRLAWNPADRGQGGPVIREVDLK